METPELIKQQERAEIRRKTASILKKAGVIGLEALAGGVAGWYISDNFIHPSFDSGDNLTNALVSYCRQEGYNLLSAGVGAIAVPTLCSVGRKVYNKKRV
jgi:hypothetical protein